MGVWCVQQHIMRAGGLLVHRLVFREVTAAEFLLSAARAQEPLRESLSGRVRIFWIGMRVCRPYY